ncbi:nuclear transport factor 2 family protein [Conexibacter woesei]|uniref:DUF4440 domain-containing protein n=1 Tax=Conexibacter woesei (strain DSM 14684 / CCUG 47730 / CIP 108061 / JCM 11494 / NBRC 100937 / ID131577) TaxID=469383 RepID=D3EZ47_CONWI|nr:nuclear transport factor 2 family protein [Conexibacter woesei]ADB51812.1 conserved hypothetical protein [Conexibacter woesei DSM 14684]
MTLVQELSAIERELAAGDGDTYRRRLTDDAVVIVPGMRLDKAECAAAMDDSQGWDAVAFEQERAVALDATAALLTYRFDGARGSVRYTALMSSVYVRREGAWLMALHQQTPLE